MFARKSFFERSSQHISRLSSSTRRESLINEKEWEWTYLRNQCKYLELERFYQTYTQRLRTSYLTLFIIMELLVLSVHCIVLLSTISDLNSIANDIFAYVISGSLVWGLLALNFYEELVHRYPWIMYATSCLAVTILAMMDMGVTVYHAVSNSQLLTPFLDSYILYAVYMFMPLMDHIHAFLLGMAVTILYLINYAFVTYNKLSDGARSVHVGNVVIEGIYLLCINFLGIYFRMMRENAIRITFLDRRKYVEESLYLNFAREEEQRLLLNIIPAHIINKIEHHIKLRLQYEITKKRASTRWSICQRRLLKKSHVAQPEHEKLFIEPQNNVTILYADVVNYTHITTTLDVKSLVETLNDLFVQFDAASEEFNVLRIKFLGDCYYAVAGAAAPNENHAKSCVDLGLRMITIIRDVRIRRKLNIDMRIGVHTGSIFSGVIGARKLQYDIWSKDVDIANRLESTGMAGRVHVSEITLKQLKGDYLYERGTRQARTDALLLNSDIRTFLIKLPRYSLASANRQITQYSKNFMQTNLSEMDDMHIEAEREMHRELDKMPVGKIRLITCNFNRSEHFTLEELDEENITSMCLFFEDWHCEMKFLEESDDMLKYSVIMGTIIFVGITVMNLVNKVQSSVFWISTASFALILIAFLILTWFKKLWIMLFAVSQNSRPVNIIASFLFNVSKKMQSCIIARIAVYLLIISIHSASTFIQLLDCETDSSRVRHHNNVHYYAKRSDGELCFNPWSITESLELTICMVFLFSGIPFIVKLAVGILISATYSIAIFVNYSTIYETGPSTNVALEAKYCHIMVVIITFIIFYLMDRQTEFIAKMDYNLRLQLQRKQEDAEITNAYITMLIHNILPSHVARIYISQQMKDELYYEEYDNVAVMFASIRNYDIEKVGLTVLNEIICSFDELVRLFETESMFKVEKIKVAAWKYMAACGLDLGLSEMVETQHNFEGSSPPADVYSKSSNPYASNKISPKVDPTTSKHAASRRKRLSISLPQDYVVYVMTRFALQLMKTMHCLAVDHQQSEDDEDSSYGWLTIGISNGPIMAGVIGSSKPHYDIWGDCVNMASRMAITGIPGRIQVTKNTAEVLNTFNIQCDLRGMTYVKGRGKMPTYFVAVDENFEFILQTKNLIQ